MHAEIDISSSSSVLLNLFRNSSTYYYSSALQSDQSVTRPLRAILSEFQHITEGFTQIHTRGSTAKK